MGPWTERRAAAPQPLPLSLRTPRGGGRAGSGRGVHPTGRCGALRAALPGGEGADRPVGWAPRGSGAGSVPAPSGSGGGAGEAV